MYCNTDQTPITQKIETITIFCEDDHTKPQFENVTNMKVNGSTIEFDHQLFLFIESKIEETPRHMKLKGRIINRTTIIKDTSTLPETPEIKSIWIDIGPAPFFHICGYSNISNLKFSSSDDHLNIEFDTIIASKAYHVECIGKILRIDKILNTETIPLHPEFTTIFLEIGQNPESRYYEQFTETACFEIKNKYITFLNYTPSVQGKECIWTQIECRGKLIDDKTFDTMIRMKKERLFQSSY